MNDTIEIENGILIPSHRTGRGGKSRWADLQIGQSIFFADLDDDRYRSSSSQWGLRQKPPRKFTTRMAEKNGVKGVRVWRIE